jgi:hypothetical protein
MNLVDLLSDGTVEQKYRYISLWAIENTAKGKKPLRNDY